MTPLWDYIGDLVFPIHMGMDPNILCGRCANIPVFPMHMGMDPGGSHHPGGGVD